MKSGEISIWRRIGFKVTQILFTGQAMFISFRTLEYMKYGDAGFFGEKLDDEEDVDLDWDFVPMMLIATLCYLTADVNVYLIFDAGRELNRKVFNEIVRLRGKPIAHRNHNLLLI